MGIADDLEAQLAADRTARLELAAKARQRVVEAHETLNAAPAALEPQAEARIALHEALYAYAQALDHTSEPWRRGALDPPQPGEVGPLRHMLGGDDDEGKVPA